MKPTLIPLIAICLLIVSCSSDSNSTDTPKNELPDLTNLYFPPSQSIDWETVSAAQLGWNTESEGNLRDFLDEKNTKAFIITKGGRIVVEWYFDTHTQNTSWYWASAGKTLTAFTVGLAQEEGLLDIDNKSSDYLGEGWTSTPTEKEDLITVWHQLTMTSGMNALQFDCVTPDCLTFVADAGTRWAYHNGPYTLLQSVVSNASEMEWSEYFNSRLRDKIGMDGFWLSTNNLNNVYFSTARSMARFGILNLNNGVWDGEVLLGDTVFKSDMINTSQDLNQSYGYLWWLNGKNSYRIPALQTEFSGELIPNAPVDTFAGLGRDDQKLYVVPSMELVIVRMGEDTGEALLGPSSFDNELWEYLNAYIN
ncbi:serine hydrolase domain-containing protein [Flagellimonas sp. S174]|uniref:serine hydrolase domain-containing protein n=1 Tax=Flagellimonas sp. S174 TaxID=3410790 RepID=UPI003BF4F55A